MAKRKEITGYIVPETGTEVLQFIEIRKRYAYWECKCGKCGKKYIARGSDITSGKSKTCGHCTPYKKDLTNYIIPETGTQVVEFSEIKNKSAYWKCKCGICGKEFITRGADITNGHTKSCGCYGKIKRLEKITQSRPFQIIDLTNQRFGKLIALHPTDKRDSCRSVIWECQCDCGNIAYISSHCLKQGQISCGKCNCTSKGELKIAQLLSINNIPFEMQKIFPSCIFPDTQAYAKFDFFVNNQYLIEYDGIQHFDSRYGWNNEENFKQIQKRDQFKTEWCKQNNIPLIRISYEQFDNLSINDLLL